MSKSQRLYLNYILEHIARIETVAAAGSGIFFTSKMHQDAIIRNFEVIGEVIKRLDVELTAKYPDILCGLWWISRYSHSPIR